MFIQTETTPNPDSLKFLPGCLVLEGRNLTFSKQDDCSSSLLAKQLLAIEGISSVFFAPDFITLSKDNDHEWVYLKPAVIALLMEHFVAGLPVIVTPSEQESPVALPASDPVIRQIKEIIELRVRPAVAQDGGDITFDRFEDGVVYLKLQGACSGCPSSSATLKAGIENMLRYYVPEVLEVRAA